MNWKPKHKYGAVACERDGKKFPSKLERSIYDALKEYQRQGKIRMFLMQVPFHLPGNVTHRVDFQVFTDDHVIFIEAKGRDLQTGKNKRKQVEDVYSVPIHVCSKLTDLAAILT